MKEKQIDNVKCHVGVYQFAGAQTVKSSEHGDMELTPLGVLVTGKPKYQGKQVLIPFANITGIEFKPEDKKAK